jgi:CRP-like cAMP-binding protein
MPNHNAINFNHAEAELINQELFHFLTLQERKLLLNSAKKYTLQKNQILIREGDPADSFFVILSGKFKVTKHAKKKKFEYVLAYMNSGDTVGEMGIIENVPRSATLKALKASTVLEFDISEIKKYPELYNRLGLFLAKKTVRRLRFLSEVTVKSMEKRLQEAHKHSALGLLMVTVLTLISCYMLSLQFLQHLEMHLPVTTIISAPMVIIIGVIMILVMKRSGFPWKTFGIRFKNWRHDIFEALVLSIPIILLLMAAKWAVLHYVLHDSTTPLIEPRSGMPPNYFFNPMYYWISLTVYIILVPLQELIVRGGLQSGFYVFLRGSEKKRLWIAIIISNLIFSLPHLYNSPYFAFLVLIPGIFWGWLYSRQKTLVGVSVSHIFIGVWMVFIVGFEQTINRLGTLNL